MARFYGHTYTTGMTQDCEFKFVYQELGGQTTADILHREVCFDERGEYYEYLPVCGVSYKNGKCILNKIAYMPVTKDVQIAFRKFVEDCMRYGKEIA